MKRIHLYMMMAALCLGTLASCTDLDETLYDQVGTQNYYNTKNDVVRATFRPFEHAFWSIQSRHVLNELTADQLITPTRDGWWDDGGKWRRLHYHEWNVEDGGDAQSEWNGCFQGIMQCNYVIEDLEKLTPKNYGFSDAEFDNLKAQCRVLRAWFYLRLLDGFRNVPLAVSYSDISKNTETQVEPKVIFDLIESDLKECIPMLAEKTSLGSNAGIQGQWTKAGAAALLVRLYLNAEVYIGEARYNECEQVAQAILDGQYGQYEVADRWDAAFDWNNDECDEVIFGFPGAPGYSFWHYQGDTYWWTVPARARYYLNDSKSKGGDHNTKYAASPSFAPNGEKYNYQLGMPIEKFRKYADDERMKLYRNLGNSTREGMFIYGYLEYKDENGATKRVQAPEVAYDLYIRDAVGKFRVLLLTGGFQLLAARCVTVTTTRAGTMPNTPSIATMMLTRWRVITPRSVCPRLSTRWLNANYAQVKRPRPDDCSTACAAATIPRPTFQRCSMPPRVQPFLTWTRCSTSGAVSSSPRAVVAST